MTMTDLLASEDLAALSPADRCDRCRARAHVRVTLRTGAELLFCGHHLRDHRAALLAGGATLHTEAAPAALRS